MATIERVQKDSVLDKHLNNMNPIINKTKVSFWVYAGAKLKYPCLLWTIGGKTAAMMHKDGCLHQGLGQENFESTSAWSQSSIIPYIIGKTLLESSPFFLTSHSSYVFGKEGNMLSSSAMYDNDPWARSLIPVGLAHHPGKILIHPCKGVSIRTIYNLGHIDYLFDNTVRSDIFPNSKDRAVSDYLSYYLSLRVPEFNYHGSLLVPRGAAGDMRIIPILAMDPSFVDGANYVIRVDKIKDIAEDMAELERQMIKKHMGIPFDDPTLKKQIISPVSNQWDWMEKPYEEKQKENMEEFMNAFS